MPITEGLSSRIARSLQDSPVPGPRVAEGGLLRDILMVPIALRLAVAASDTAISDFAFANIPDWTAAAGGPRATGGALMWNYRFFGTTYADLTYSARIIAWPEKGHGMPLMDVAVTLGARDTATHPTTLATGASYYEADTLTITNALAPYEVAVVTDGSSILRIDMTGHAWHFPEIQLGDAVSALVIGRAL